MTLSLETLELSNIRSHEAITFSPADEGVTSIQGANGTGKSTLVDSIAWCLYGTKPQGVSKALAIIREGAEIPKDKVYARVTLNIDNKRMKVERRIVSKNGGVECEVFLYNDNDDSWTNVAGPAVTHAEPYIRKMMHMDERGFLAAILVQQKQVDQLISTGPRERAQVIEKLTGISSVTSALTEARQEYNTVKKMASFSTVDENELGKLGKEQLKLEEELEKLTKKHNNHTGKEKELKRHGLELKQQVEEAEAAQQASLAAEKRLATVSGLIEAKETELTRVVQEKEERKNRLSSLASGGSLKDVEAKVTELNKNKNSNHESTFRLKTDLLDIEETIASYRELVEISTIKDLDEAQKGLDSQKAKLNAADGKIQSFRRESNSIESKIESIASAITIIEDQHGECPTCLQKVNNVQEAVTALREENERLEASKIEAENEEQKFTQLKSKTESNIDKFTKLVEALAGLSSKEKIAENYKKELEELAGAKKAIDSELKSYDKIYSELKAHEDLKNEYDSILRRAQSISSEIEQLKGEVKDLQNNSKAVMAPAKLAKLKIQLEESRTEYLELSTRISEERGEVKLLRERHKHLEEKIEASKKAIENHKELLKNVEVSATTTKLLEEFRVNRIENSVPLIEAYASDLLSRFTEGKFTRFKLDGKFNASVVLADGNERAIGLLSGGELSAAAMALRLAISMILNGGTSQNLIILDEVLVSQDSARAELILAAIKDVCKGQVVLIAHNDSINDVADKLVQLN